MFKTLNPDDSSIHPFKVYKSFTFTDADSGSGVFGLEGISGSILNFSTSSAASQSYGEYNSLSSSIGRPDLAYSIGTFYKLPTYFSINKLYYLNYDKPYLSYGSNNTNKTYLRLNNKVNVITVPQKFFGEKIKPKSIKLLDNSTSITFDIRDDGDGNLYDYAYSSSYAAFKSSSFSDTGSLVVGTKSGSVIGNVFYSHGILTITDTGSYSNVGLSTGTDGFELGFKSTHTIYEYEYTCTADPNEFNNTANISVSYQRSGSNTIHLNSPKIYNILPPGDNPTMGTGSFKSSYIATDTYISEVTHSEWNPYITTVGLYNDFNELLAVAKLGHPIKNDNELKLSIIVRFDL